jgi:hypothetical protein
MEVNINKVFLSPLFHSLSDYNNCEVENQVKRIININEIMWSRQNDFHEINRKFDLIFSNRPV